MTNVRYEVPINRHFDVYKPPCPIDESVADSVDLDGGIVSLLKRLVA